MRWPLATIGCLLAGLAAGAAGRWLIPSSTHAFAAREGQNGGRVASGSPGAVAATKNNATTKPLPAFIDPGPRPTAEELLEFRGLEFVERLIRWLPAASAEDFPKFIHPRFDLEGNEAAEHAVYLRWVEIDPEAAVRFATGIGNAGPAWTAWAQTDPDKALARAAIAPGAEALASVLQTIAETDPEKAVRLGDTYRAALQDPSVQVALAEAGFDDDPRGAVERACSVSGNGRETPLLEKWAKADPDAALAWAKAQANHEVKSATTHFVFRQWADSQPEKLLAAIEVMPPGQARATAMSVYASSLLEKDPQGAIDYALGVTGPQRRLLIGNTLNRLAGTDPKRALGALSSLDNDTLKQLLGRPEIVTTLGRTAPAETMDWLAPPQRTDGLSTGSQMLRTFGDWMKAAPHAATAWLAARPGDARPVTCVKVVVDSLLSEQRPDYEAAWQWSVALPDGGSRDASLDRVFTGWLDRDPDAAARALDAAPLTEAQRHGFREKMVTRRAVTR